MRQSKMDLVTKIMQKVKMVPEIRARNQNSTYNCVDHIKRGVIVIVIIAHWTSLEITRCNTTPVTVHSKISLVLYLLEKNRNFF